VKCSDVEWTDVTYAKWFCFEMKLIEVTYIEFLRDKSIMQIRKPYTEVTWEYCDCFISCVNCTVVVLTCFVLCGVCMYGLCNIWVCVCMVFVMCGCFGDMCTCIYRVFVLFRLCIFILFLLLFNFISYVFYCYVYVFLLLRVFCSVYSVLCYV
jgi:hypothetical protein